MLKRKIHLPKVREAAPPVHPWKTERAKLDLPRVDQPVMADAPSLTPQRILTTGAGGVLIANDALNSTCCRWPIGDPQDAAFHFCGGSAIAGLPYCQGHAVRAYKAPLVSRSQTADYNRQRGASVFGRGRAMTLV